MSLATFRDLCMDAVDPRRLGEFWATVLGLEFVPHDDGAAHLAGSAREQTVWINPVREPKSVKHRVHLDVHVEAVSDLESLGASVLERSTDSPWAVMADPEGGEFCAFVRDALYDYRLYEVVVDSRDAGAAAQWWADVLDGKAGHDQQRRFAWVENAAGIPFDYLVFQNVPERKRVKNRIHWHVGTGDVAGLLDAGATLLRRRGDDGIGRDVLADPEGNEFCAFPLDG